MPEKLLGENNSLLKHDVPCPIPISSFTELSNHVRRHFLPDQWEAVENFASKIYPGTKQEFNAACIDFFKTQIKSSELSIEEIIKSHLVLSVYDFLNHLGIKSSALNIQDQDEQTIKALEKLLRVVVNIMLPELLGWINSRYSGGFQIPIEVVEDLIEKLVIIEGYDIAKVQKILLTDHLSEKDRTDGTANKKKKELVIELYWNQKHNFKDLRILGKLLRDDYGCLLSPVEDLIMLFDLSERKKKIVRWHSDKFDQLVILINKLYSDDTLPLELTYGKGHWKAAQNLFVDYSGKSFRKKFGKHHSRIETKKPGHYKQIEKEVDEIISEMRRQHNGDFGIIAN